MDFLCLGAAFAAYSGFIWLFMHALVSFDIWLGERAAKRRIERKQGSA